MKLPRASGILLHPTSLPGPHSGGDMGPGAYHFVDWLVQAGQSLWQILPLGGIGAGNSPYMSSSAFAGNVLLIDLAELRSHGACRHGATGARRFPPSAEQHERRDTTDAEARAQLRLGLGVHLRHDRAARLLGGQLLELRRYGSARPAPGRPKIH
jgi:4-alpha-glucanotransferase